MGKVPARIKFMLQDVQELRGNNWVPRQRQEESLKTIDQVRGRGSESERRVGQIEWDGVHIHVYYCCGSNLQEGEAQGI